MMIDVQSLISADEISWRELSRLIQIQVPDDLALHYSMCSFPVLMNRYKQDYFLSADKKVRVTIDNNVQYFDQRSSLKMNKTNQNISPDILIMEVKVDANNVDSVKKFTKDVYLQRTQNSKYVVGVSSILGY